MEFLAITKKFVREELQGHFDNKCTLVSFFPLLELLLWNLWNLNILLWSSSPNMTIPRPSSTMESPMLIFQRDILISFQRSMKWWITMWDCWWNGACTTWPSSKCTLVWPSKSWILLLLSLKNISLCFYISLNFVT